MRYLSTRGRALPETIGPALAAGLAPDGGLFVPAALPLFRADAFGGREPLATLGAGLLEPFFLGDGLAKSLPGIAAESLEIVTPMRAIESRTWLFELFHGPTAAFKDFGARFLAACLAPIAAVTRCATDHTRRDVGRHRCRGRRRVRGCTRRARRDPLSRRPRVAASGASARLLRRQRRRAARGRLVRRLPAPGQAGARRRRFARARATHVGEQHQPRPAAAANDVLRSGGARGTGVPTRRN